MLVDFWLWWMMKDCVLWLLTMMNWLQHNASLLDQWQLMVLGIGTYMIS